MNAPSGPFCTDRVRVCPYGRFRDEKRCSVTTPNPQPWGCKKRLGVSTRKILQQRHVQSELDGSICSERLSAVDSTNMSMASAASTARSHGSKGEKWKEMAVGRYANAFTNCICPSCYTNLCRILGEQLRSNWDSCGDQQSLARRFWTELCLFFLHARNSYTYDLPNSAGVEITNLFVSPGKSDLWNASLQVI